MQCKKGLEVKPLRSPMGYYMGTVTEEGLPNCRLSTKYAKTKELALKLALDRQTCCIENEFCNGGSGCF